MPPRNTMKPKHFLVLDTETATLHGDVFDVGYTIINKRGEVKHTFNALVREVFSNRAKMKRAFYYDKVFTKYLPMLERGSIVMRSWLGIVNAMRSDVERFNVDCIAAYNAGFDLRVMKATNQEYGTGSVLKPMPILDIWLFACLVKMRTPSYRRWCHATGHVSEAGNVRSSAEACYRYISGNWTFEEDHTALSDALIESEILASCFKRRQKIPYNQLNAHPWRIVQGAA